MKGNSTTFFAFLLTLVIGMMFMTGITKAETPESIDLTKMSVEELLALRSAINIELLTRPEADTFVINNNDYESPKGTKLLPGMYMVGIDIPAGSYQVFYNGVADSTVEVYYRRGRLDSGSGPSFVCDLSEMNTEGRIVLEDENLIIVKTRDIIIKKASMITTD